MGKSVIPASTSLMIEPGTPTRSRRGRFKSRASAAAASESVTSTGCSVRHGARWAARRPGQRDTIQSKIQHESMQARIAATDSDFEPGPLHQSVAAAFTGKLPGAAAGAAGRT